MVFCKLCVFLIIVKLIGIIIIIVVVFDINIDKNFVVIMNLSNIFEVFVLIKLIIVNVIFVCKFYFFIVIVKINLFKNKKIILLLYLDDICFGVSIWFNGNNIIGNKFVVVIGIVLVIY